MMTFTTLAGRHQGIHIPRLPPVRAVTFFPRWVVPLLFFLFLFVILVGFFWCVLPTRLASIVVFASAASRYTKRVPVKGLTTVATRVLNWYLAPARPLDNKTFLPLVPLSLFPPNACFQRRHRRPTRACCGSVWSRSEPVATVMALTVLQPLPLPPLALRPFGRHPRRLRRVQVMVLGRKCTA